MQAMPEKESGESLGAYLTRMRTLKGESLEDLAHRVRLAPEVVRDIESDAWDKFETEAYIRGYVNSIGQHFGLDKATLMGYFNESYHSRYNMPVNPLSDTSVQKVVPTSSNPALVIAAVIVLLIALVVVLKYFSGTATPPEEQRAAHQEEVAPPVPATPDSAPAMPDTTKQDTVAAVPAAPSPYPAAVDTVRLRCHPGTGADTLCRVVAEFKTSMGKDTSMSRYFKNETFVRSFSRIDTLTVRLSNTDRIQLFINGARVRYGSDNVLWIQNSKLLGGQYASNPWRR